MKRSLILHSYTCSSIKKNDVVYLSDGSALSLVGDDEKNYYIVYAYPEITGSPTELKYIPGRVIEINVKDRVLLTDLDWGYVQDIIVEIVNYE